MQVTVYLTLGSAFLSLTDFLSFFLSFVFGPNRVSRNVNECSVGVTSINATVRREQVAPLLASCWCSNFFVWVRPSVDSSQRFEHLSRLILFYHLATLDVLCDFQNKRYRAKRNQLQQDRLMQRDFRDYCHPCKNESYVWIFGHGFWCLLIGDIFTKFVPIVNRRSTFGNSKETTKKHARTTCEPSWSVKLSTAQHYASRGSIVHRDFYRRHHPTRPSSPSAKRAFLLWLL